MNRGRGQRAWRRLNEAAIAKLTPAPPAGLRARGRLRDREMNALETAYAAELEARRGRRALAWWAFEAIVLRLADRTHYKPDFAVMGIGGELEIHETKGYWREDARLKIKLAAAQFPFRFLGITRATQRGGSAWIVEEF